MWAGGSRVPGVIFVRGAQVMNEIGWDEMLEARARVFLMREDIPPQVPRRARHRAPRRSVPRRAREPRSCHLPPFCVLSESAFVILKVGLYLPSFPLSQSYAIHDACFNFAHLLVRAINFDFRLRKKDLCLFHSVLITTITRNGHEGQPDRWYASGNCIVMCY